MVKLYRKLPINIIPGEVWLFEKELECVFNKPVWVRVFFLIYDFHELSHYKRDSFFNISRFVSGKLSFKAFLKRGITFLPSGIILIDRWSNNYFHWFTEVIPKLLFIKGKKRKIALYVPEHMLQYDFIHFSLALFDDITIKPVSKPTVKLLFVAEAYNLNVTQGNYQEEQILQTIAFIKEKGLFGVSNKHKRMFVYRDIQNKRGIINFHDIEPILDKYSIKIVDFSSLTWGEQVRAAAGCELLIGAHGAGLTNMMFMPLRSKVFELRKKNDSINNCYFSLASILKHDYFYQCCEVDDEAVETQQNNFYLDVVRFEDTLKTILA